MEPAYDNGLATIYQGKDLEILPHIADASVDLVITSPPYNVLQKSGFAKPGNKTGKWSGGQLAKGYEDHSDNMDHTEYVKWQQEVLRQLWTKLTDTGAIFYNHRPTHRNKELWLPLELNPGLPLRDIIIWDRGGGINSSPSHFTPACEWIMIFAKPDWQLRDRAASNRFGGNVWRFPPEHGSDHPAPFPLELPSWAIQSSADVRTVLDPYAGSGTTLRAASDMGIRSIGIELSSKYVRMSAKRLEQISLFEVRETNIQESLL